MRLGGTFEPADAANRFSEPGHYFKPLKRRIIDQQHAAGIVGGVFRCVLSSSGGETSWLQLLQIVLFSFPPEWVVSVYFAESKIKTLAPSLTRRGSRKLEPTQASSASHSFPLPSPTSSLSLPQLPTATSHSQLPARSPFISRAAPDVYSSGAQSKPRVKGGCETLDARG